jgi:hypothetical protein
MNAAPMTELVLQKDIDLRDRHGRAYSQALVYAQRQPSGRWGAWVEFVSASGETVVRTEIETAQSSLSEVVFWTSGLTRPYFESALDRACRRPPSEGTAPQPATGGGMVSFRVRTRDPRVSFRLMAATMVLPGQRRVISDEEAGEGVLIYVRTVEPALTEMPRIYEFLAHFLCETAAAPLAEQIEAALRETGATLEIRRADVPIDAAAILTALLTAAANSRA